MIVLRLTCEWTHEYPDGTSILPRNAICIHTEDEGDQNKASVSIHVVN